MENPLLTAEAATCVPYCCCTPLLTTATLAAAALCFRRLFFALCFFFTTILGDAELVPFFPTNCCYCCCRLDAVAVEWTTVLLFASCSFLCETFFARNGLFEFCRLPDRTTMLSCTPADVACGRWLNGVDPELTVGGMPPWTKIFCVFFGFCSIVFGLCYLPTIFWVKSGGLTTWLRCLDSY